MEYTLLVPLIAMMVFIGVYPKPFLTRMEPAVQAYLSRMHQKMAAGEPAARSGQLSALSHQPKRGKGTAGR